MTSTKNAKTYPTYDVTPQKKRNPKLSNFFRCSLEDLPHLLQLFLTALLLNRLASYGVAKWSKNGSSM